MRLIDADELRKCAIPCVIHNGALTDMCVPLYQIDNAQTIEERSKGQWILVHPLQENDEGAYMCSVCHSGDWAISSEYEFCPYCGADMRGCKG